MPWIELESKWAKVCCLCRGRITPPERILWHSGSKQVKHMRCPKADEVTLPEPNGGKRVFGMPLANLKEWPKEKDSLSP